MITNICQRIVLGSRSSCVIVVRWSSILTDPAQLFIVIHGLVGIESRGWTGFLIMRLDLVRLIYR